MALNRPAVLVAQEFATQSTTPATPELNVCVTGPCYQILDYPEDAALQTPPAYGAANSAATGTATSVAQAVLPTPGVRSGAAVDTSSVKVTLIAPVVEVLAGACTSTSGSANLTLTAVDAVVAGVVAGDTLVMSNAGGTITVRNLVRSVTSATVVVMNNQADATAYTKFRIERTVADAVVTPSAVAATTVTLPAGLAVSGKPVVYSTMFIGFRALRTDLAELQTYESEAAILAALGKFDARNPLCVGTVIARRNTASSVQAFGITSDDATGYSNMRAMTSSRKDMYAVVPLTQSISVLSSFKTEFTSIADPTYVTANGVSQKFRVVVGQPGELPSDKVIVDTQLDGDTDNTDAAIPAAPAANAVVTLNTYLPDPIALGILPGYKLVVDTTTYTVASILSATTLTVDGTPVTNAGPVTVKFQTPAGVDVVGSSDASAAITVGAAAKLFLKLTDANGTFVDAGAIAGDFLEIPLNPADTTFAGELGRYEIATVTSNQTVFIKDNGRDTSTASNELPHGYSRVAVGGALVVIPSGATVPYRVVRALDSTGQVNALIASGPGSLGDSRAWITWPDLVDVDGLVDGSLARASATVPAVAGSQPGYYLSCAVGGLVATLPSHHNLTRMSVAGIKKLYHSNTFFSESQISALSNNGWMVFQQTTPAALPEIIHSVTTDVSTVELGEAMMVKNRDYVSIVYAETLEPFIGKWNINDETLGFVGAAITATGESLRLDRKPKIGARINSAQIAELAPSTISPDRLEVKIEVDFPKPLNTIMIHLVSA